MKSKYFMIIVTIYIVVEQIARITALVSSVQNKLVHKKIWWFMVENLDLQDLDLTSGRNCEEMSLLTARLPNND